MKSGPGVSSPTTTSPSTKTDSGAVAALVIGSISLIGLIFPLLLGAGAAAIVLGWMAHKRVRSSGGELKGNGIAIVGIGLGVVGSLLSLVFPAFIVSVWIYAAFHGGQLPGGA
jgi:hypothetical protein